MKQINYIILFFSILFSSHFSVAQLSCGALLNTKSISAEVSISLDRLKEQSKLNSNDLFQSMKYFYAFEKPDAELQDRLFISSAILRYEVLVSLKPESLEDVEELSSKIVIANLRYLRSYSSFRPDGNLSQAQINRRREEIKAYILEHLDDPIEDLDKESSRRNLVSSVMDLEGPIAVFARMMSDGDSEPLEEEVPDTFDEDNVERISRALRHLSPIEIQVYVLHHAYGLSPSDIAKRLFPGNGMGVKRAERILESVEPKIRQAVEVMTKTTDEIVAEFVSSKVSEAQADHINKIDYLKIMVLDYFDLRLSNSQIYIYDLDVEIDMALLQQRRNLKAKIIDVINGLRRETDIKASSIEELKQVSSRVEADLKLRGLDIIDNLSLLLGITIKAEVLADFKARFQRSF